MSSSDKYSIGFGTVGDDDFDEVDNSISSPSPAPVMGLSDSVAPSQPAPNLPVNNASQTHSDSSVPTFLNDKSNAVPDFLNTEYSPSAPQNIPAQASNYPTEQKIESNLPETQKEAPKNFENFDYLSTLYPDMSFDIGGNSSPIEKSTPDYATQDYSTLGAKPEVENTQNTSQEYTPHVDIPNTPISSETTNQDSDPFAYNLNSFESDPQPWQPTNSAEISQPPLSGNMMPSYMATDAYPLDRASGGSGGSSFLLNFARIGFLFLIVVAIIGGLVGGYFYYKPIYIEEKQSQEFRDDFINIKVDLNLLSESTAELYTKIEEGKEENTSQDLFEKEGNEFWFEIVEDSGEIVSQSESLISVLEDFKTKYSDSDIAGFESDINQLINFSKASKEYADIHITTGRVILNMEKELYEVDNTLKQDDLETAEDLLENIRVYLETSKKDFSERLYSNEVIQSYDLLSYYFDYVENQISDIKEMKKALSENTTYDAILKDLSEEYSENDRIEAERLYYGSYTQNQFVSNKDKFIENLESNINQNLSSSMPKFIYDAFSKVDEQYSLP